MVVLPAVARGSCSAPVASRGYQNSLVVMSGLVAATSFELLHLALATKIIQKDEAPVAMYRLDRMGFDVVRFGSAPSVYGSAPSSYGSAPSLCGSAPSQHTFPIW